MNKEEAELWVAFAKSILSFNVVVHPAHYNKIEEACKILEVKDLRTHRKS